MQIIHIQSEQIEKLAGALSKAQGAIENPKRSKTVVVETRKGGEYTFNYATLADIRDVTRKPLADNGLSFVQVPYYAADTGYHMLRTIIMHESGQFIGAEVPLMVGDEGNQAFGSALTFMKRYVLSSMLGVVADDDDDANAADGNQIKAVQTRQPREPKPDVMSGTPQPAKTGTIKVTPAMIPVPLLGDGSGSDWVTWGREFANSLRSAPDMRAFEEWMALNKSAYDTLMGSDYKKLASNLNAAVSTIRNSLESKGAINAAG